VEPSDWRDYLGTLIKKPSGAEHTVFFNQMPKLWQEYIKSVAVKERKSALTLLSEIVADGNEEMCDRVLELAGKYGSLDPDDVRQCYFFLANPGDYSPPLSLASSTPDLDYPFDLSAYDILTREAMQ